MSGPYRDPSNRTAPLVVTAQSARTGLTIGLGSAVFFLALAVATTASESWLTTTCIDGSCVVRARSLAGDARPETVVAPGARLRSIRSMVQPGGKRSTAQNPAVPRWTPQLTRGDASTVFCGAPVFSDEAAGAAYVQEQNAALARGGTLVLAPDRRPAWIVPALVGELVALALCALALARVRSRERIAVWREGGEVVVSERSLFGTDTWRSPLRHGARYRICGESGVVAIPPEMATLSMPLGVVVETDGVDGESGEAAVSETVIPLRVRRAQLLLDVIEALEKQA